jgi:hypothetical protein
MEILITTVIGVFVFVGIVALIKANSKKNTTAQDTATTAPASDCCGAHEVCEFDKIKADETIIEYYDDEELDAYRNIEERAYTSNQIEEFREVLYTLQTHEIRYWLLSIERRNIQLPTILKSEARMLMSEV